MPIVVESTTPPESKDEWRTPPELFGLLEREFRFDLDAAATKENALCPAYFTTKEDALSCDWDISYPNTVVFCNPPFSRVGDFLIKGREEAKKGVLSVFLIRADATETKWWREGVLMYPDIVPWNIAAFEIRFLTPRVQFLNTVGNCQKGVTFPSAVVIMGRPNTGVYWWNWKK
jgi:phage N-6-adenine-methyltransferase